MYSHNLETRRTTKALLSLILATTLLLGTAGYIANAGIFGMEDYPGGELRVVFEIEEPGKDAPTRIYTTTVTPGEKGFDVMEKVNSPGRNREDVSSAFGASGGAGAAGSQYEESDLPSIDLSPIRALDDRNVEVQPNQQYLLPDGGRFVTEERGEIAGVSVVYGTYVHSNYPNQQVKFALADNDIEDLLLFPPLLERREKGKVEIRIELIEFSHEG
ncbi:MAG: hypothetical protein ACLFVS_01555 [Candidatus Acetothermia bacterium]